MKKRLAKILVCPSCRGDIKLKQKITKGSEIIEGQIFCTKCNDRFPIKEGIPRFVKDKTKGFLKTEIAFSEKWKKHHKNHQASDWIKFQTRWFLERYGWESLTDFKKFLLDKKNILDAGTGVGNSVPWPKRWA